MPFDFPTTPAEDDVYVSVNKTAAWTWKAPVWKRGKRVVPPVIPVTPTITAINPSTQVYSDTSELVTVTGTNFVSTSEILFKGVPVATTFISPTQMSATINPQAATVGAWPFTVQTGALMGTGSVDFTVTIPKPVVSSVSPDTREKGTGAFTITVDGSNFTPDTDITYDSVAQSSTTVVSATRLQMSQTAPAAGGVASATVSAVTLGIFADRSEPINYTEPPPIPPPAPTLGSIVPNPGKSQPTGLPTTYYAYGTGFTSDAQILQDGNPTYWDQTTFRSSTELTFMLQFSVSAGQSYQITVKQASGTSNAITYTESW